MAVERTAGRPVAVERHSGRPEEVERVVEPGEDKDLEDKPGEDEDLEDEPGDDQGSQRTSSLQNKPCEGWMEVWIGEQTAEQEQHDLCFPTWRTEAVMDLTRRPKDKLSRLKLSCPKLSRWRRVQQEERLRQRLYQQG